MSTAIVPTGNLFEKLIYRDKLFDREEKEIE